MAAAQEHVAELVELLVRRLVDSPDAVEVRRMESDQGIVLEVRVAPEDMGKVIGRQGRIIKALRTVAKAAGLRAGKRVTLEILQ